MAIPFIVLGVAASVIGAGGHLSAKETNEEAQRISYDAEKMYNNAKTSLEASYNTRNEMFERYGNNKMNVLNTSMKRFVDNYEKIKHVELKERNGLNETSKFKFDDQSIVEIKQLTDIYSSAMKDGATGAAAGAAIALAASGSLGVVTTGLSLAGTMVGMGEVGAALNIAGSALSFGAAMTPLSAVAAPVVLFTGISASMKADENLEKARTSYAEAEAAVEKMKTTQTMYNAMTKRAEMFDELLNELNVMFDECSRKMAAVIRKKEGLFIKKKVTSDDFSEEEQKLFAVTRSLASAITAVIDFPLVSKDGGLANDKERVYDRACQSLPDFKNSVEMIRQIDFKAKAKNEKPIAEKKSTERVVRQTRSNDNSQNLVLSNARNVLAFVVGIIIANNFASSIASAITLPETTFFNMDAYFVNTVALWLVLFVSAVMVIGNFENDSLKAIGGTLVAGSMFVLFHQYCKTVLTFGHYILFSVVFLVGCALIFGFLDSHSYWSFAKYLSKLVEVLTLYPIMFLISVFVSSFLGVGLYKCFTVSSILILLSALSQMKE